MSQDTQLVLYCMTTTVINNLL